MKYFATASAIDTGRLVITGANRQATGKQTVKIALGKVCSCARAGSKGQKTIQQSEQSQDEHVERVPWNRAEDQVEVEQDI